MDTALVRFPIHGANILEHFSLPSFHDNFDPEKGILDEKLNEEFLQTTHKVKLVYGLD